MRFSIKSQSTKGRDRAEPSRTRLNCYLDANSHLKRARSFSRARSRPRDSARGRGRRTTGDGNFARPRRMKSGPPVEWGSNWRSAAASSSRGRRLSRDGRRPKPSIFHTSNARAGRKEAGANDDGASHSAWARACELESIRASCVAH